MDFETFQTIFIGTAGAGAASVGIASYRNFKWRRLQKPWDVRNAGFWTDRRIVRTEVIVCALIMAIPWTGICAFTFTRNDFLIDYILIALYPFLIWLLMRGLRAEFADQRPSTDKGP